MANKTSIHKQECHEHGLDPAKTSLDELESVKLEHTPNVGPEVQALCAEIGVPAYMPPDFNWDDWDM